MSVEADRFSIRSTLHERIRDDLEIPGVLTSAAVDEPSRLGRGDCVRKGGTKLDWVALRHPFRNPDAAARPAN